MSHVGRFGFGYWVALGVSLLLGSVSTTSGTVGSMVPGTMVVLVLVSTVLLQSDMSGDWAWVEF